MELNVCCSKKWAEAQEKIREINDTSFNNCIARIITMTLPRNWEIEECRNNLDECTSKVRKAYSLRKSLEERYVDDSKQVIYANKVCRIFIEKYYEISNKVKVLENGGQMKAYIFRDTGLDFYFVIRYPDGKQYMNGGIIWHKDHWEIHT